MKVCQKNAHNYYLELPRGGIILLILFFSLGHKISTCCGMLGSCKICKKVGGGIYVFFCCHLILMDEARNDRNDCGGEWLTDRNRVSGQRQITSHYIAPQNDFNLLQVDFRVQPPVCHFFLAAAQRNSRRRISGYFTVIRDDDTAH